MRPFAGRGRGRAAWQPTGAARQLARWRPQGAPGCSLSDMSDDEAEAELLDSADRTAALTVQRTHAWSAGMESVFVADEVFSHTQEHNVSAGRV